MLKFSILFTLIHLINASQNTHGKLAVRPFTVHFFHDTFGKNLTVSEVDQYLKIFRNDKISKDQGLKKVDSIAHEKSEEFEKNYLKWKKEQEKHNIQWWQVNDLRVMKTSTKTQNLYESIKAVHFNRTLSFQEDCSEYNKLIEGAEKTIQQELEWSTLNCSIEIPELNSHGRLDFKLIL